MVLLVKILGSSVANVVANTLKRPLSTPSGPSVGPGSTPPPPPDGVWDIRQTIPKNKSDVGVPAWIWIKMHHSFTKLYKSCSSCLFLFGLLPFFSPQLVVKSIKLSVSLAELHHLAAVKAKQTR